MGDVLPISALLTATPIADPAVASPPAPGGETADPFAELLAVVVGAQGAAALAATPMSAPPTGATVTPPATADSDVAALASPTDSDDEVAPDAPKTDDGTLDDRLAATLSAMLAIAPPPPVAAPVRAAPAEAAASLPKANAIVPVVTPAVANAAAAIAGKVDADAKGTPAPQVGPGDGATSDEAPKDSAPRDAAAAASAERPQAAKAAGAPGVPAAILRMLREAQASTALSGAPAPAAPSVAAIPATAASEPAPPAAPAPTRDAQPTVRRDDRPGAARAASAATSAGRTVQPRAARSGETARRIPAEPIAMPFADLRQPVAATDGPSVPASPQVDSLVQNQLTIAQDGKWLDSLARDIAASTNGSDLHFKLNPENLGSLTVSIAAQADGTAVRMTADTERARTILTDAQPRLVAEARAQGLRISDTQVDLNNNSSNAGGGSAAWGQAGSQAQSQGERRSQTSSPNHLPLPPTRSDEAVEAPEGGTSERYA